MSNIPQTISNLCEQWHVLTVARLFHSVDLSPSVLSQKVQQIKGDPIIGNSFISGKEISDSNPLQQIKLMSDAVEKLIYQFHGEECFPDFFSKMFKKSHLILSSLTESNKKVKALHTKQIVDEERLSAFSVLNCEIFEYLTNLLEAASKVDNVDFTKIDLECIEIAFKYLFHSLPNKVHANAGVILSVLSSSPVHLRAISDNFWRIFAACKKDDDFRNFATYIDGVEKLRLSFDTPDLTQAAIHFLKSFTNNAKKIERGVLRMKFLSALKSIISRLGKSPSAENNEQFNELLNEIWDIAIKWSSKQKHLIFCLEFCNDILKSIYPSFFINNHGLQYLELLYKATKGQKGSITCLQLINDIISNFPYEFHKDHFPEMQNNIKSSLVPLLFKTNEKIQSPRFSSPEQIAMMIKIFTSLASKEILPVIDFILLIFNNQFAAENKKGKLFCLNLLAELVKTSPKELESHNLSIYSHIQPILLSGDTKSDEFQYAIITFPNFHSSDVSILAQISQVLFDISNDENSILSSSAYFSLIKYIEDLVSLELNPLSPIKYMNALYENITVLPKTSIISKLSYLLGINTAYCKALSKEMSKFENISSNKYPLTVEEWSNFRISLDKIIFSLLVYPDEEIVKLSIEIEKVFMEQAFIELDKICFPDNQYHLCNILEEIDHKNIIGTISQCFDKNVEYIDDLFDSLAQLWSANSTEIEESYFTNVMKLLSIYLKPESKIQKTYYEEVFKKYRKTDNYTNLNQSLTFLSAENWAYLLSELAVWMSNFGLDYQSFWIPITNIMHIFAKSQSLKSTLEKDQKLIEHFEHYCHEITKSLNASEPDYFSIAVKTFQIMSNYIKYSPIHFTKIAEYFDFISYLLTLVDFKAKYPSQYLETVISTYIIIFEHAEIEDLSIFNPLFNWVQSFIERYKNNEQHQIMIVHLLEVILKYNPKLLRRYFTLSYSQNGLLSSNYLLAIANVYKQVEDFDEKFENGTTIVLSAILMHLRNDDYIPRQAAQKLMCLLIYSGKCFTNEAPTSLMMTLTSQAPAGYLAQYSQFLNFAASNISSKLVFKIFSLLSDDFNLVSHFHRSLLPMLTQLLPSMVKECEIKHITTVLYNLSCQSNINEIDIAVDIEQMWSEYYSLIQSDSINEIAEQLFKLGIEQNNLRSKETLTAINALIFAFQHYPKNICDLLLPIVCKYDSKVPKNADEFNQFISDQTINFTFTKEEIVAANTLSQIILFIQNSDLFMSLFVEKLASLTFFSIMIFNVDEFNLSSFHPLLDSILNTALFKLATSPRQFSSNLMILQSSNLALLASSLEQQYQIYTSIQSSKQIIAYDQKAICSFTELLCQCDPEFKSKFFDVVFSTALKVVDCPRSSEPFLILMALNSEITSRSVFQLLLFSIVAFKNNRTELVDVLIDIIKQRLLSETLSEKIFKEEITSVISVFILYLSLDCRFSLSLHLIKVIKELSQKISSLDSRDEITTELNEFLNKFGGNEYVASLYIKFIANIGSFGDQSVIDIIESLYEISNLFTEEKFNWCFLLSLLIDGCRHFISENSNRHLQPILNDVDDLNWDDVDNFSYYLCENFKDIKYCTFIINFYCNVIKTFKTNDLNKDTACIILINSFVHLTSAELSGELMSNCIKISLLSSVTTNEVGTVESAKLIHYIILKLRSAPRAETLSFFSLNPQFDEATFKTIGYYTTEKKTIVSPNSLPSFPLFQLDSVTTETVISTLLPIITAKLESLNNQ